jgi:adenylosuccinate lyase
MILNILSGIAQSCYKFAFDLRVLQSVPFGELSEGFGKKQVGSSAMPFKKNPITCEKICSLARYISTLPQTAWENAGNSLLERTLDDSANRRIIFPNAFLAVEEILISYNRVIKNLVVNERRIKYNLEQYGVFSATEVILMECVKNGANRQEMHETLREMSLNASQEIQNGKENPLRTLLVNNPTINKYLKREKIGTLLNSKSHIGDSKRRALNLIKNIKS